MDKPKIVKENRGGITYYKDKKDKDIGWIIIEDIEDLTESPKSEDQTSLNIKDMIYIII